MKKVLPSSLLGEELPSRTQPIFIPLKFPRTHGSLREELRFISVPAETTCPCGLRMQIWENRYSRKQQQRAGVVLHSHPPRDTVPPQARMAGALHRYRPLQKGQTAGCDAKACLVTSIPESCWWHGHLHTLDPVPRPQATSPADMPHLLFVVQNSYVTDQEHPTCLSTAQGGGGGRGWQKTMAVLPSSGECGCGCVGAQQ